MGMDPCCASSIGNVAYGDMSAEVSETTRASY